MPRTKKNETPSPDSVSTAIVEQKKSLVKTDVDIDSYIAKRQAFITKVNSICVEGKDYHVIQGKKSLAKGGAEKIASIFHWTAMFTKDSESLEMLGAKEGLVAFKCSLSNGEFVGEGRGAALLTRNNGDPNKTLKMAQKSAFIDAVLRASGLSDFFTQDLEDMPKEEIKQTTSPKQKQFIADLCKAKGVTKDQLLELVKEYNNPSSLIDYLKALPKPETVINEEGNVIDANTGEQIEVPF